MEEIKLQNNPLGIKVYAEGKPEMSGNEYSLLVSAFADKMDELLGGERAEPDSVPAEMKKSA